MVKFGIGQAVTRVEDQRLITGQGCYTDDLPAPHAARAYILRSPHAHALIKRIDTSAARQAPGVALVLTGADVVAEGLEGNPCLVPLNNRDGSPRADTPSPILAGDKVRYVGEPVALVVADTLNQARDAAELIAIDFEALPAATDTIGATEPGAAQVWEHIPHNIAFDWGNGDQTAVEAAFANAAHVTKVRLVNNRIVVNSMEPRPVLAEYDPTSDRSTLYTSNQGPSFVQGPTAAILKLDKAKLRCMTADVGGGFGMKVFNYPEYALTVWASRKLKRAVRYSPERSDAFVSDVHGRDNVSYAEAALDGAGRLLALRVTTYGNLGAYLSNFGPMIVTQAGTHMLSGVYQVPAVYVNVKGVLTNTVPVDAYRGAGRPEAAYVIERVIDAAARELNLSPAEIRRRNFIAPEQMPYKTPLGNTYDSGEFATIMDKALAKADWAGFAARRREAEGRGRLRGIGMAYYIERCGGGNPLPAIVQFNDDDTLTVLSATQTNGQGHETSFLQILVERLGVPPERIKIVQGDTDRTPAGISGGSRSLPVGGAAIAGAADEIVKKGKLVAAQVLEAAAGDIEFKEGMFGIVGTDRRKTLFEVARAAKNPAHLPSGVEPGLDTTYAFKPSEATYPNGCHVCEVEIDRATGAVSIKRYTVVDDFGAIINPLLLAGQVHGGIAQGAGQALLEQSLYDPDSGQLLTGSFMDYAMPRADLLPPIDFNMHNVPCQTNPLGIKGAGEAGAVGAPPAVVNAVVDALQPVIGIVPIDMPVTAEKVWALLRQ
ncbi:MAG: xanthine dehydrogenase family protein molybdopterin-binding subunit [Gammaproteobacteria bacterium]